MHRFIIFIFVIIFVFGLTQNISGEIFVIHSVREDSLQIPTQPAGVYQQKRQAILNKRNNFRQLFYRTNNPVRQKEILDSAGKYLVEAIVNDLMPHWYGTPWSFEGYTEIPQQGSIACGYFVSTVLQHVGFNLNRYKMAQQNPECEVFTLHQQTKYIHFEAISSGILTDSVRLKTGEGLYIFGKQNHVGFMLHQKDKVYLIHSNYVTDNRFVMPEFLEDSQILSNPPYIFFGEISTNHKLIKQWIDSQPITIVMPENGK